MQEQDEVLEKQLLEENIEIFKSVKNIFDLENPKHKPATTSFKTIVKRPA